MCRKHIMMSIPIPRTFGRNIYVVDKFLRDET